VATVGDLITTVGIRVRDPQNTGTSRAIVRDLFSRAQQYVNAAFDSILNTVPLATVANQAVYPFASIAPDIIRIKAVRHGVRDLSKIDFNKLRYITPTWFGTTGPRFETYSLFGRQTLILHPNQQAADSVNVVYTQQLPAFVTDADTVLLPDDQIPFLERLVEALLLLKGRDMNGMKQLFDETVASAKGVGSIKEDERATP
jgi:hypothetical protein